MKPNARIVYETRIARTDRIPRIVRIARIALAGAVVMAGVAGICKTGVARADAPDHMKCRRVDAPAATAGSAVDLDTVAFGIQVGCIVKGAAREICVPAGGEVLAPARASDTVEGEALQDERLCYQLSCPVPAATAFVASDRFGTRTITLKKAKRFCTPVAPPASAETSTD